MTAWPSRPTLLSGIPAADYHGDIWGSRERPTFSRSIAVELLQRSPKHAYARHPKLGGKPAVDDDEDEPDDGEPAESTEDRDHGSLYHNLLLGGGKDFEIIDADSFRTKVAKEKRDAALAAGKVPVIEAKWQGMRRIADHVRVGLTEAGISLADNEREVVALWEGENELAGVYGTALDAHLPGDPGAPLKSRKDGEAPIRCKAMLDLVELPQRLERAVITDLKIVKYINTNAFVRSMDRFGLDIQSSMYVEALETIRPDLAGRVKFQFALVEKKAPYDVAIIEADKMLLAIGNMKLRVARARWARCLATGQWPGVGRAEVHFPPYILSDAVAQYVAEFGTDSLPDLEVGE